MIEYKQTYENRKPTITLYVDGVRVGFICVDKPFGETKRISYIEVLIPYRHKGYFKLLLIGVFKMFSCTTKLISNDRYSKSNAIYSKILGRKVDQEQVLYWTYKKSVLKLNE